jgi:hypothetical protein
MRIFPHPEKTEMAMKDLFDCVPTLVNTYGKWPSYLLVLVGAAHGIGALVFVVVLHHALR